MMRSLFAGVAGLQAHQVRMDVIGNNIANVNTTAFKASRVNFADMFSQTLTGGSRSTSTMGGTNPRQVGLGVAVSTIDVIQTQGSPQMTGEVTDMAIDGEGFFVLRDGGRYVYTRAGNFRRDDSGYLVNPATGQRVQGWMPDSTGAFPARDSSTMTDLRIDTIGNVLAKQTTKVTFAHALNANSPVGTTHTTAATVIDSLGKEHSITFQFTKNAANEWNITATDPSGVALTVQDIYGTGTGTIRFNPDGSLADDDGNPATPFPTQWNVTGFLPAGANPLDFKIDIAKVIQPVLDGDPKASTIKAVEYDGYASGSLTGINIDGRGVVTGYYSNGAFREIGQVALGTFTNPGGLLKDGANNWVESVNSGTAVIGAAAEAGRGAIASSNLEMSNVDLSAEFTSMIVTQRGFQANSRTITTADEMLQEIVNLKR